MKLKIYENRKILTILSVLILIVGALLGYFKYGTSPWENIGGTLCGFGLIMTIRFITLKQPQ